MSRMSIGSLLNEDSARPQASSTSPSSSPTIPAPLSNVAATTSQPTSPLDVLVHASEELDPQDQDQSQHQRGYVPDDNPYKRRRNGYDQPTHLYRVPSETPTPPPQSSPTRLNSDDWFNQQHSITSTTTPLQPSASVQPSPMEVDQQAAPSPQFHPYSASPEHPIKTDQAVDSDLHGLVQDHDDPDRQSMPPPATTKGKTGRKKPGPKPKVNTEGSPSSEGKQRKKPGPKPKPRDADGNIIRDPAEPPVPSTSTTTATTSSKGKGKAKASNTSKKNAAASSAHASSSRSRSTSAMPPASSVPPESDLPNEGAEDGKELEAAPDKLYCVCQSPYDDGKVMIACDRCDEWFHTACVEMPDLVVDLVDQFFCPLCIAKNPQANLRTTYKPRCLNGLVQDDPDSPNACHKPARGAFSKYCSEDCGVRHMRSRINAWEKEGGSREVLWKNARKAEKPEGVVVRVVGTGTKASETDGGKSLTTEVDGEIVKPDKGKTEREVERLNKLLDHVLKLREDIMKGMEALLWREKVLELATARAEQSESCGWDQRLCFGDDEVAEYGAGALESYETASVSEDDMSVDNQAAVWWCPGDKVCDRHEGWQVIRQKDIRKEKEQKEDGLAKLTTREREIRKRIEDITDHGPASLKPSKSMNGRPNISRSRLVNGDLAKKTKKRKALA